MDTADQYLLLLFGGGGTAKYAHSSALGFPQAFRTDLIFGGQVLALQAEVAAAVGPVALPGAASAVKVEADLLEVGLDDGQRGARAGRAEEQTGRRRRRRRSLGGRSVARHPVPDLQARGP